MNDWLLSCLASAEGRGGGLSSDLRPSSDVEIEFGNKFDNEDNDKSITWRWIRSEGKTLSEKTGRRVVSGMGNGGGDRDPNRIVIA